MTAAAEGFQPVDDDGQGAEARLPLAAGADPSRPANGHAGATCAISRAGFLDHVDACVRHLAAWLGAAAAPDALHDNDFTSAERSRVQLWRWLHGGDAALDDGTPIDFALFDAAIQRVGERLPRRGLPGQGNVLRAAWLLAELTYARTLADSVSIAVPARGC
jgi:malate synthase